MAEPMKFDVFILPDGEVIYEVTERGSQQCSTILKVAQTIGTVTSDEVTGPEGDKVHEVSGEG